MSLCENKPFQASPQGRKTIQHVNIVNNMNRSSQSALQIVVHILYVSLVKNKKNIIVHSTIIFLLTKLGLQYTHGEHKEIIICTIAKLRI